jgi:hypothetical protein
MPTLAQHKKKYPDTTKINAGTTSALSIAGLRSLVDFTLGPGYVILEATIKNRRAIVYASKQAGAAGIKDASPVFNIKSNIV